VFVGHVLVVGNDLDGSEKRMGPGVSGSLIAS
jgi:hypothetical protein